jgi:hypothetical protein
MALKVLLSYLLNLGFSPFHLSLINQPFFANPTKGVHSPLDSIPVPSPIDSYIRKWSPPA